MIRVRKTSQFRSIAARISADILTFAWLIAISIFAIALLSGCPSSRDSLVRDIEADIWVNQKLPTRICNLNPDLWNYGVERVVNCSHPNAEPALCQDRQGTYEEFVPYCDPAMKTFASMRDTDRKKWFEALRREIK